jgi:salicylate 5-hydroxylase large subunit
MSFDPGVEPIDNNLGVMGRYFDRVFDGRELKVLGYMRQRINSNWKLMFENLKDPYHASVLHVFLMSFGLFRMDQESAVEMDATGRHSALISRRGGKADEAAAKEMSNNLRSEFQLQDSRLLDVVREFPGEATVVMQTLWPNLIVQQQSNTLAMRQLVPRGPGAFDLNWTFFGYADDTPEMTQRRVRQANLMGPSGLVSVDDSEVLAMSQNGLDDYPDIECIVEMGGKDTADTTHMITEVAIRAFYKHYIKVMGL